MNKVILFAKTPRVGEVKTRLVTEDVTKSDANHLYTAFLKDSIRAAGRSKAAGVIISFTPEEDTKVMNYLALDGISPERFVLSPQEGEYFHQRIYKAFQFAGSGNIVMIGSDCPSITADDIDNAFALLEKGNRVVIGPSGEGGIYLIGLEASFKPKWVEIFGEGAELINLAKAAADAGKKVELLPEKMDIDIEQDLASLVALREAKKIAGEDVGMAFTSAAIDHLKLKVVNDGDSRSKRVVKGG